MSISTLFQRGGPRDKEVGAFCARFSFSMASVASSADDYDTRSETPSTCGHWTAPSSDEDEEEVVEVGDVDVAITLSNEDVKKGEVCVSDVAYETNKEE